MAREPNETQAKIIRLLKDDENRTQTAIAEEVGCADSTVSEVKKAFENNALRDPDSDEITLSVDEEGADMVAESLMQVGRQKTGEERKKYLQLAARILSESAKRCDRTDCSN